VNNKGQAGGAGGPKRSLADVLSVLASAPPGQQQPPSKVPRLATAAYDHSNPAAGAEEPLSVASSDTETLEEASATAAATPASKSATDDATNDEAVDYIAKFLTGEVSFSSCHFPDATILTPGQLNCLAKTLQTRRNAERASLSKGSGHGHRTGTGGKNDSKGGDSNFLEKTVSALQAQILKLQGRNAELKASLQSERDHYEEKLDESRKVQERSLRAYMKATVHSLQMLRKGV
jgi:hypothetical protein